MSIIEVIIGLLIMVIIALCPIVIAQKIQDFQTPNELILIANMISNLQSIAIATGQSINICGIKLNPNQTLHNCATNQQVWSSGVLAYINKSNTTKYHNDQTNERIYLLPFSKTSTAQNEIYNIDGTTWQIAKNGKLKKNYKLKLTNNQNIFYFSINELGMLTNEKLHS